MVPAQQIVGWIIQGFEPTKSVAVERAIENVLVEHGVLPYEASLLAERRLYQVLRSLKSIRPESLPFELSTDEKRLIGTQKFLQSDSSETRQVRERLAAVDPMLQAVYNSGNRVFEMICARLMMLSGADECHALCTSDEGGIDVYGRIPLRLRDGMIRQGLLQTTLLNRRMLLLGQCKCYAPATHIGRSDITDFHGAIEACLNKYEGYDRKPSHRVPENYYRTRELCIRVFFTTASYADRVDSAADSHDIVLINGRQIAEFLVYHRIGLKQSDSGIYCVDDEMLHHWACSNPSQS